MGYKRLVINRVSDAIKEEMRRRHELQFVWKTSPSHGKSSNIFTHVLPYHYSWPDVMKGYDYRQLPNMGSNVYQSLVQTGRSYQQLFGGAPHVMVPMGDDFTYDSLTPFDFIDMAIAVAKTQQASTNVVLRYSTLNEYFGELDAWSALNGSAYKQFTGDFYPYGRPGDWWTGYFTTRPELKGYSRLAIGDYRTAQVFSTYGEQVDGMGRSKDMIEAIRDISICQHHDAITGTSKPYVMDDYISRLGNAVDKSRSSSQDELSRLLPKHPSVAYNRNTRISFNDSSYVPVIITNSLGWDVTDIHSVRVDISPTSGCPYSIWTRSNNEIDFDCVLDVESSSLELVFTLRISPQASFNVFISNVPSIKFKPQLIVPTDAPSNANLMQFKNKYIKLNFGLTTKMLQSIETQGVIQEVIHSITHYADTGGVYSFYNIDRAVNANNISIPGQPKVSIGRFRSTYQVDLVIGESTYPSKKAPPVIKIKYTIKRTGLQDVDSKIGFSYVLRGEPELITVARFQVSAITPTRLFVDNSMVSSSRPTMDTGDLPSFVNAAVSFAGISNNQLSFICNIDRTRGAVGKVGALELSLHRCPIHGDNKGMDDRFINDRLIEVNDQCYLSTGTITPSTIKRNSLIFENGFKSFISSGNYNSGSMDSFPKLYSKINLVHLLTLTSEQPRTYLVRLMSIDDVSSITVDIGLVARGNGFTIEEINLDGYSPSKANVNSNPIYKIDSKRILTGTVGITDKDPVSSVSSKQCILGPLEIKTFIIRTNSK
ncbi:hypothetical protein SAMD00019534_045240 [Acytostelium subglobosum LB1]|uniref:hypothetical protein n=1 Tax=Acytostelium subglobosum LB1 TaxID=1410327 RepID=UPI000644F7DB|nr:hypothetical protein SAMD00019534_045240 [Acytostelium subglobosum LB1]GAM21349.1 hypothetical protein SAMD00019534_045240 [Acytostelium subglobosum LB1]|eukprot:XP_012755468.1 hypothetical protein SAMD00019534_045240 [Acytostelium subglobosum LB1]